MENFECWLPSWGYLNNSCNNIAKELKEKGFDAIAPQNCNAVDIE